MQQKSTHARIVRGGRRFLDEASLRTLTELGERYKATHPQEPTGDRAWVRHVLTTRALSGLTALNASQDDDEPVDTAIVYTLANLMHLCDATGNDFYQLLESANTHHSEEISGDVIGVEDPVGWGQPKGMFSVHVVKQG